MLELIDGKHLEFAKRAAVRTESVVALQSFVKVLKKRSAIFRYLHLCFIAVQQLAGRSS